MTDISETLWQPGDIVEYDDYGSKFRGRLVEEDRDGSRCWTGIVTEIDSVGDNVGDLKVGSTVSLVEGHSTKIAHAPHAFKPGDKVRADLGEHAGWSETGVVNRVDTHWKTGAPTVHFTSTSSGLGVWAYAANAELLHETPKLAAEPSPFAPPARPLVGPAPEVAAPVFVAPFKAINDYVVDNEGNSVLEVNSLYGLDEFVTPFAEYVAAALNARVAEGY